MGRPVWYKRLAEKLRRFAKYNSMQRLGHGACRNWLKKKSPLFTL